MIKKRLLLVAILPIFIILSVFLGLVVFSKTIAEYGLQRAGLQNAHVESVSIGLDGVNLLNLKIENTINVIGRLHIGLSFGGLLHQQLGTVVIENANLAVAYDAATKTMTLAEQKIQIAGQEAEPAPVPTAVKIAGQTVGQTAEQIAAEAAAKKAVQTAGLAEVLAKISLPFRSMVLNHVTLVTETPAGKLPIILNGSLNDLGDKYDAKLDVGGESDFAKIDGKFIGGLRKSDQAVTGHLDISESRFRMPNYDVKRVSGWVAADIAPQENKNNITAQITVGALNAHDIPIQDVSFTASYTPKKTQVLLNGSLQNKAGTFMADFSADQSGADSDQLSLKVESALKSLEALQRADMRGKGVLNLSLKGEKNKSLDWLDVAQWKSLQGEILVNSEALSLGGLLENTAISTKMKLSFDPVTQKVTAQSLYPAGLNGVIKPLSDTPLAISIAGAADKPSVFVWDHKLKSLSLSFTGFNFYNTDGFIKDGSVNLTAHFMPSPVLEGNVKLGLVTFNRQDAYILPFALKANFLPAMTDKASTAFDAEITEKNDVLKIKIKGQHNIKTKKGNLEAIIMPMELYKGVTPLKALFPITGSYIQNAYGTIGFTGQLGWSKAQQWSITSSGSLLLKEFESMVKGNTLSNINTVLNFESLIPPVFTTQTISIGLIQAGLPFTDGLFLLSLDRAGKLTVNEAECVLAKGTVRPSPFSFYLRVLNADTVLTAKGIDLGELFQLTSTEGLIASGKVNGTIPLHLQNGVVSIEEGVFESEGTGKIGYNPKDPPEFLKRDTDKFVFDLQDLLKNFTFDSLKMVLNGEVGKIQKVNISLNGKNPGMYGNRPVAFNINLEGPLQNVVNTDLGASHIPDNIKEKIEEFEKKNAQYPQ